MNSLLNKNIIAALDLGSQTFRIAVLRCGHGNLEVLASETRHVRLGEALYKTGRLSNQAIQRGIEALREFRTIMEFNKVDAFRACGTAALRQPENSSTFLKKAKEIGIPVEVISEKEEADIAAKGVYASLSKPQDLFLILDIGGGSTELSLVRDGTIIFSKSFPLGAVNLYERHIKSDPPREKELESMKNSIREDLKDIGKNFPSKSCQIVGIGGACTTTGAVFLSMGKYDPSRIRGMEIFRKELEDEWKRLCFLNLSQRKNLPGLLPQRADIIISGLALLLEILHILDIKKITLSDGGLLLGLVVSLLEKEFASYVEPTHIRGIYL